MPLYLISSSLVLALLEYSGSLLCIVPIAKASHFGRLESSAKIEFRCVNRDADTKSCRRKDVGNRKECEQMQHAN